MSILKTPRLLEREYLPKGFKITSWSKLKPYYNEIINRQITSVGELERWILDWNELDAVIEEELNRRYIQFTQNRSDESAQALYEYIEQELYPKVLAAQHQLNQLLIDSPFCADLDSKKYFIFIRSIKNKLELFSEQNRPLIASSQLLSKQYDQLLSSITINLDNNEISLLEANSQLENTDRSIREKAYRSINDQLIILKEPLNNLFDELFQQRQLIAQNAHFDNYRDYKFKALERFDYAPKDCNLFHEAILAEVKPIVEHFHSIRKKELNVPKLRPWDTQVNIDSSAPIKTFNNTKELIAKTTACLSAVDPYFGTCLSILDKMEHLDLGVRTNKYPRDYNMPLPAIGIPFIFLNTSGSIRDTYTMVHESGHAVHSFLTRFQQINCTKKLPSEVSELAATTMVLLSMDHWNLIIDNKEELRLAKISYLENILSSLLWIATIDHFQQWLYMSPQHTKEERYTAWLKFYKTYASDVVQLDGLESYIEILWQRQAHLFERPFSYIEYGIAQLGAIAIWQQYQHAPKKVIEAYISALKLGYSKPIGEIYKTAGIKFDFSKPYVKKLAQFVKQQLNQLIDMS